MDFLADSASWRIYLGVLLGPFVQEDAAVIAAATLSVTKTAKTLPLFLIIWLGLFLSDIWKYWIGWAGLKNKGGRAFAEKKHIAGFKDKVLAYTLVTMVAARFVPLTRIPIYIACGFFGVHYLKYCLYIALTALMYVAVIFAAFHLLGNVLGEQLIWVIPVAAITCICVLLAALFFKQRRGRQTVNQEPDCQSTSTPDTE